MCGLCISSHVHVRLIKYERKQNQVFSLCSVAALECFFPSYTKILYFSIKWRKTELHHVTHMAKRREGQKSVGVYHVVVYHVVASFPLCQSRGLLEKNLKPPSVRAARGPFITPQRAPASEAAGHAPSVASGKLPAYNQHPARAVRPVSGGLIPACAAHLR